jgi:hypothetical protein
MSASTFTNSNNNSNNNNIIISASRVTSIKVTFNGELRRFPFPIDGSVDQFAVVSRAIAESFGIAPPASLVLQYVDDENDVITIGSQLELLAAISTSTAPILRLTASTATANATTTPTVVHPLPLPHPHPHPYPHGHPHSFGHHRGGHGHGHGHGHGFGFGFGGGRGSWGRRGCGEGGRGRKHADSKLHEQYKPQIEELEREGLNCGFWAVRILANLNGDVEAAKTAIRARKATMNDLQTKYSMQLAALQTMGFIPPAPSGSSSSSGSPATCSSGTLSDDESERANAHNHCVRKCTRLLERYDGNVEQVASHIRSKQAEREKLPAQYATQLQQLREQGFWCEPVCLRMLHKFDGDVDKVVERMSKFRKFSPHHHAPHHQLREQQQQQQQQQYEAQLQGLMAKGYSRWSSTRLLRKFDGDVNRVERALDMRKQWFDTSSGSDKRREFKQAKMRYAKEIKQLKEMGFRCKWLMVPLLIKYNGDVAAVSMALA